MDADTLAFFGCQSGERQIVQIDETPEQRARWVELHRQAAFREVDLDGVRSEFQAAPHFADVLRQQVFDELLPRVVGDAVRWVQKAQSRG